MDENKSTRLLRFSSRSWIKKQMQNGKINFKTSNSPTHTENYLESLDNQLSSSGTFSQDLQRWRFTNRFKTIWRTLEEERWKMYDSRHCGALFLFARFTKQISSVSTEQWRVGVVRFGSIDSWSNTRDHGGTCRR